MNYIAFVTFLEKFLLLWLKVDYNTVLMASCIGADFIALAAVLLLIGPKMLILGHKTTAADPSAYKSSRTLLACAH